MEILIPIGIAAVGVLLVFMPALMKEEARHKRRTNPRYQPSITLAVFDEIFHPRAYSAIQEIETQMQVPAPAPLPGDPLRRQLRR